MSFLSRAPSPVGTLIFARSFTHSRRDHPPSTSTRRRGVASFSLIASLGLGLFIVGRSPAIFRTRGGLRCLWSRIERDITLKVVNLCGGVNASNGPPGLHPGRARFSKGFSAHYSYWSTFCQVFCNFCCHSHKVFRCLDGL